MPVLSEWEPAYTDSAVLSARDPFGLTALVRLRFEITPIPDLERLSLDFRLLPTGPVFVMTGEPFVFYQIETSPDFGVWTPSEPVSSETGENYFKPADPNATAGFYRVRSVD